MTREPTATVVVVCRDRWSLAPETVHTLLARTDSRHVRHGERLVLELRGLHRNVVAEPFRLLVGVGVTPDVHEQGRVIDRGALVFVEADLLGEPERDEALAQHVLHRLAEAEIDPE